MSDSAYERIYDGLQDALAYATADAGDVFPPRDEWDVLAYNLDETVQGYRDWTPDDPTPGPNHSPAYRWGWANSRLDHTREEDGYGEVRRAYARMTFKPN